MHGAVEEHETHPPPAMDMMQALPVITPECASTMGNAKPVTTTMEVRNRPKSTAGELASYDEPNSSFPQ